MKPFLIAEIGINHNGDMDICKNLIDVAADAGARHVSRIEAYSTDGKTCCKETPVPGK